jgi:hypothetical protein
LPCCLPKVNSSSILEPTQTNPTEQNLDKKKPNPLMTRRNPTQPELDKKILGWVPNPS